MYMLVCGDRLELFLNTRKKKGIDFRLLRPEVDHFFEEFQPLSEARGTKTTNSVNLDKRGRAIFLSPAYVGWIN